MKEISCRVAIFLFPQRREKGELSLKKSYEFYAELIQEQGLTSYKVALAAGIPQSCFTQWKLHDTVPKWARMQRIAEVLSTAEKPLTAADFYNLDEQE